MSLDKRIEKIERQLVRMRWFNRCLIICIFLSLAIGCVLSARLHEMIYFWWYRQL